MYTNLDNVLFKYL